MSWSVRGALCHEAGVVRTGAVCLPSLDKSLSSRLLVPWPQLALCLTLPLTYSLSSWPLPFMLDPAVFFLPLVSGLICSPALPAPPLCCLPLLHSQSSIPTLSLSTPASQTWSRCQVGAVSPFLDGGDQEGGVKGTGAWGCSTQTLPPSTMPDGCTDQSTPPPAPPSFRCRF